MNSTVPVKFTGTIRVSDHETGLSILESTNDVLYGNMSTALAHSLLGNPNTTLAYLALGNGGAYVGPTGVIEYKPSLGGVDSLVKNPNANLYSTVYVRKLSASGGPGSPVTIPSENLATNYEDIQVTATLDYNQPEVSSTQSANIAQLAIDNTGFVGSVISRSSVVTIDPGELVFSELGLFAGTNNLFSGDSAATADDLNLFISQRPNFQTGPDARSKLMLTHAIFHPVQKSANRAIDIEYTLRIQMGALATVGSV